MLESRRLTKPVAALAITALVLTALTGASGLNGWVVAIAGTLAQPLFALAARHWQLQAPLNLVRSRAELAPLLALWVLAFFAFSLLVAWPLSLVLASGSLLSTLSLSAVIGIALLALWRWWPLWQGLEHDGGSLSDHWRARDGLEPGAWRGLVVAVAVAAISGLILCLAWPGLAVGATRWVMVVALAAASVGLHGYLQRVTPADALEYLGEEDLDDDQPQAAVDTPAMVADEPDGESDAVPTVAITADDTTVVADEAVVAEPATTEPTEPLEPALYEAARGGRVERALELMEAGADPHAPPPADDRDQRSLAVLAAVLPDLRLLRGLIAHGVDLNGLHAGITPLLAATRDSWHGRPDAVTTLLANGADPRATDGDGNTPLHLAARSSDPGVAALLLDAAADLEALNNEALSPLGVACAAGNWRLAKFMLERGAKPEPVDGQPALLAAAGGEDDDTAGVALLLKMKARADTRDSQGRSALHQAVRAGHAEIIDALLAAGADPAATDDQGANILTLACQGEGTDPELLRKLIALGIDPQRQDNDDKRAIDYAAQSGRWPLVAVLDPDYAFPSRVGDDDQDLLADRAPATLLRDGLAEGREEALEEVAALLDPRQLGALLHDGDTALPPRQIAWLLAHGADPEVRDGRGITPMFAMLNRGPAAVDSLPTLLDHAVSPAGMGGLAGFLGACVGSDRATDGLERLALELLERGADPFGSSAANDPPLTLAVRLGWRQLLDRLLATGVDLDARDSRGMSALHLAAALGRQDMLKPLIAHGAAPDLLAADGQTPLGVALAIGRRDLADWLDWRGWPLPRRRLQPADVPAAAIVGDADAVRRLLELGFPVDATDSQGCSALLRASGGGHRAVVDLLLTHGADPRLAAGTGATPLSAAVSMRHTDIVERLLGAGADIEQRLPGGLTALMVACALGLPDLAARLVGAGADVRALDAQQRGALHCAAMFGFAAQDRTHLMALFDILLLAGAEADLDAEAGHATPLLLLLGARAEPGSAAVEEVLIAGLEQLVDHDARLDAQDPRGFGPLHLAALHGLPAVVAWLLRAGADPDLRDTLNRTAREIAVMRGFVDIAAQLSPGMPGGDVSMARLLRDQR